MWFELIPFARTLKGTDNTGLSELFRRRLLRTLNSSERFGLLIKRRRKRKAGAKSRSWNGIYSEQHFWVLHDYGKSLPRENFQMKLERIIL